MDNNTLKSWLETELNGYEYALADLIRRNKPAKMRDYIRGRIDAIKATLEIMQLTQNN